MRSPSLRQRLLPLPLKCLLADHGRPLCAVLSIIMILYLWGSCIAYLVIVGDSFSPLVALVTGKSVYLGYRTTCSI